MTTGDSGRDPQQQDRGQDGGQVSEAQDLEAAPEPVGGADATDKSTGTAAGEAAEPDA